VNLGEEYLNTATFKAPYSW